MRRYSKSDRIDAHVRHLVDLGWKYWRGGKHGRAVSPDGKVTVTIPGTPSDRRAAQNFERDLRKAVANRVP